MIVSPPYQVQQRASDCAFELINTFADRLTLEQHVRITVIGMYAPERLGWSECGETLALDAIVRIRMAKTK